MKKKAELNKEIATLRSKALNLLTQGDVTAAKEASDQLEAKLAELESLNDETENNNTFKPINGGTATMTKDKDFIKKVHGAVNQFLRKGWQGMDAEAKTLIKPVDASDTPGQIEGVDSRGGVLVPVETADFVVRESGGVYRLRDRVQNFFPRSKSGKIPMLANPTAGLVAQFDEFPASGINRGQITFGSINYSVKDYGLIIPVSNDLLRDANVDVFAEIMEQFARAQRNTENEFIVAAVNALTSGHEVAITGWQGICKALNSTTPIGSPDKVIITNSDGVNWLDTLTNDNGTPILTQALVDNPRMTFRGYEVIQLSDATLPTATPEQGHDYGAIPFIVGQLYDAAVFVERQNIEIMYNPYADSAFAKNATDVRVTCRLDCQAKFGTAVQKLTYTPAND